MISLPLFDYAGGSEPSAFGQLWFLSALGVLSRGACRRSS